MNIEVNLEPEHKEMGKAMPMVGVDPLPVAPERVCYEAHWRNRSVYISAPCQSAREWQWHCLASAILLERLEDACTLAETMLDSSLHFFVSELPEQCDAHSVRNDGYLRVVLSRDDDEVDIWIPSRAHSQVAQHSSLLNAPNLRWSDIQARVKLAQVALDDSDLSRLMTGSLLLIPASWDSKWICSVDVPQLDQSLTAILDPVSHSLELHGKADKPHNGALSEISCNNPSVGLNTNVVHAFLEPSIRINPRQLMVLDEDSQEPVAAHSTMSVSLTHASCQCLVNEHAFSASLLPIGDGYGLCITEY